MLSILYNVIILEYFIMFYHNHVIVLPWLWQHHVTYDKYVIVILH